MTVVQIVDELKVPHVDSFETTKLAAYLSSIYDGLMLNRRNL